MKQTANLNEICILPYVPIFSVMSHLSTNW